MLLWLIWSETGLLYSQSQKAQTKSTRVKYCDNMDLSTFCVIGNHFRHVAYDETRFTMKYYKQFAKIVETFFPPNYKVKVTGEEEPWPWIQDHFDEYQFSPTQPLFEEVNITVPLPGSGTGPRFEPTGGIVQGFRFNLYSVNDMCSLDKLYSPVYKLYTEKPGAEAKLRKIKLADAWHDLRLYKQCPNTNKCPFYTSSPPVSITEPEYRDNFSADETYEQFMVNPFEVKVTEITVNGRRLHNHLHFSIGYKDGVVPAPRTNPIPPSIEPATPLNNPYNSPVQKTPPKPKRIDQLISYAFVIVHDQNGWPVGDFNTGVKCYTCQGKCQDKHCHQSNQEDTIPCMILSEDAVTVSSKTALELKIKTQIFNMLFVEIHLILYILEEIYQFRHTYYCMYSCR